MNLDLDFEENESSLDMSEVDWLTGAIAIYQLIVIVFVFTIVIQYFRQQARLTRRAKEMKRTSTYATELTDLPV